MKPIRTRLGYDIRSLNAERSRRQAALDYSAKNENALQGGDAPLLVLGITLAVRREVAGRLFQRAKSADRWLLPASGWSMVAIGVYVCQTRTLGLF